MNVVKLGEIYCYENLGECLIIFREVIEVVKIWLIVIIIGGLEEIVDLLRFVYSCIVWFNGKGFSWYF